MSHRRPESPGVQARGGATEIRRLGHRPRGLDFTGFGDEKTQGKTTKNGGKMVGGMKKPGKNQEKWWDYVGFHWFGMRKRGKTGKMMGFHGFREKLGLEAQVSWGFSPGKMGRFDCRRFLVVVSGIIFFLGCHKQRWNVIGISWRFLGWLGVRS